MVSALNDARGGNKRDTRVFLQIGDVSHSAIAHCGFDLVKALCHILAQRSGIYDVRINAFLKAQPTLAAEVVPLPVAGAV